MVPVGSRWPEKQEKAVIRAAAHLGGGRGRKADRFNPRRSSKYPPPATRDRVHCCLPLAKAEAQDGLPCLGYSHRRTRAGREEVLLGWPRRCLLENVSMACAKRWVLSHVKASLPINILFSGTEPEILLS